MAGIGFELRRILKRDSFTSLLGAYGLAGVISSGPWVLSVLGVMLIGIVSINLAVAGSAVVQFLVSVTYLMAISLTLSGLFQHVFTRWVADRLYDRQNARVLPNLMGVIWVSCLLALAVGLPSVLWLFPGTSTVYKLLMLANFVVLCNLWPVTIFLSSMKSYRRIVIIFALGYATAITASLLLARFGLEGLLAGLLLGHSLLFFSFFYTIIRQYPGDGLVRFDFTRRSQIFPTLIFTGLLFNAAVWADKFIFWFHPDTSQPIIGALRASIIYDLPIFLAYLAIIPGMAVFLVRMETDFSEAYERFYNAVREGDTLGRINGFRDDMVRVARNGIYEICKVQGLTVIVLFLWADELLSAIGISTLYLPLFYIDLVAVSIQLILLAIQNVLFYLDARGINVILCALFFATNILFTLVTIELGASFYGYGYAGATLVSALTGLALLSRKFDRLEYETFMLQGR
ncbi:MAG TPA: exopolysaccharide Pel transporter PelG [Marinobacter sp.]|uniref:exopolysaccharide Pel transporter PelG n=1 Tax=Marinobacter sp. TaxID=50741 RepID=UPI00262866CD|nr:exopolysaccharide Pel transporter PelG [Marinobacter sp.]HET8802771.1 exopolysaccharide Pel transporter PelG [Marinobacter sp.]